MTIRTNVDFASEDASFSSTTMPDNPVVAEQTGATQPGPSAVIPKKSDDASDDMQNNIDIDDDLSYDDDIDSEGASQQPATRTQPDDGGESEEERRKKYEAGINEYAGAVVGDIMKGIDFTKAMTAEKPEDFVNALQSLAVGLFKQTVQASTQIARHYASVTTNDIQTSQRAQATEARNRAILNKELEQYPAAKEPRYRSIIREKFAQAMSKTNGDAAKASKAVVAYLKKNFPDALVIPQTKQTDGMTVDDWFFGKMK